MNKYLIMDKEGNMMGLFESYPRALAFCDEYKDFSIRTLRVLTEVESKYRADLIVQKAIVYYTLADGFKVYRDPSYIHYSDSRMLDVTPISLREGNPFDKKWEVTFTGELSEEDMIYLVKGQV